MKAKRFFEIFRNAIQDIYKNPGVFVASLVFFLFVFSISFLGKKIAPLLQNSILNIIWVLISFVILIAGAAFLFGGLLDLIKQKKDAIGFFNSGRKFWFRNFLLLFILWILTLVGNGILFLFTKIMIFSSDYFTISAFTFRVLAFLIYFFWLIFFVIFFTFSNCYCVLHDLKLKESVKKSFSLVNKEYLATLSLLVVLFIITFFLNLIPGFFGEIILYLISLPLSLISLAKFVFFEEK